MLPIAIRNDVVNSGLANFEFSCQVLAALAICAALSYCGNVIYCQLNHAMFISFGGRAMRHLIGSVLLCCTPSKIVDSVVVWIAIKMSALHSIWAWCAKQRKHQCVNMKAMRSPVVIKHNGTIASRCCCRMFLLSTIPRYDWLRSTCSAIDRQYYSTRIDRVPWKTRYYTKAIWRNRISLRHALFLTNRVVLRSLSDLVNRTGFVFMKGAL